MEPMILDNDYSIQGIFPCPIYAANRNLNLDSIEEIEIEDIIQKGLFQNKTLTDYHSNDSYLFDTKLKNLKKFCEQHIENYVEQVINPIQELDFYITQSWLNVVEPGGSIHRHWHANSIISGSFYISTEEDDRIVFTDPNKAVKGILKLDQKEYNVWNSQTWFFPVENNLLFLFPSWLEHEVAPNEKATTNRISLAFNVFAKGNFGRTMNLNELILQ